MFNVLSPTMKNNIKNRNDDIINDYKQGKTVAELHIEYALSETQIKTILNKAGRVTKRKIKRTKYAGY